MARTLRLLGIDLRARDSSALVAGATAIALSLSPACGGGDDHAPLAGSESGGTGNGDGTGGAAATGSGATSGRAGRGGRGGAARDGGPGEAGDGGVLPGDGQAGGRGDGGADGGATRGDGGSAGSSAGGSAGHGGGGSAGMLGAGGGPLFDGGATAGAQCATRMDDDPWAAFARQGAATDPDFGRFGAVSSDELTVVWTSSTGDVFVADRPKAPGSYAGKVQLNQTTLAVDRAAMDPTGLLVMAVAEDRGSLVEYRRPTRAGAFVEVTTSDVGGLHLLFEGGGQISEPVLGADKDSFFFLMTMPGASPVLFESKWSAADGAWGAPHDFSNAELVSRDAAHRRRPTGVSSDGRTLFYYDEIAGNERGAWRATPEAEFDLFVDIGDFPDAAPNLRCSIIYYSGSVPDGAGIYTGG